MSEEQQDETVVRVPVECWTRVVGYYRPVSAFNPGKAQEVADRRTFTVPKRREDDDA